MTIAAIIGALVLLPRRSAGRHTDLDIGALLLPPRRIIAAATTADYCCCYHVRGFYYWCCYHGGQQGGIQILILVLCCCHHGGSAGRHTDLEDVQPFEFLCSFWKSSSSVFPMTIAAYRS
jgi:hypothetical protein